jgi:ribosomal protein S18 acetylase RimI-like enzyme
MKCRADAVLELGILVVSPHYQRKGIGTMLLEDGLLEADARGIQAVLGASPEGIGLYRKYGFVDFEVMNLNLWEYEGGEGMGVARHVIMRRPPVPVPETK